MESEAPQSSTDSVVSDTAAGEETLQHHPSENESQPPANHDEARAYRRDERTLCV